MDKVDLSVIIPSRNEEFLQATIEDLLRNIEGNTEIIAILDGVLPDPPLTINDDRLTLIYHPQSVGQRAACNGAARIAKGKYLMKVDAHCAFDKGFDVKMMAGMKDDWTTVPVMRNLHIYNWVCTKCKTSRYQGRSGSCEKCGGKTEKDIVWIPKTNPSSKAYRFDKTMHFQYWGDWARRQTGDMTTTMSIQGSCFMITKKKWFELDICSEYFHSWGQQGVEVACKTWLSGGEVRVNRNTWYGHCFRTQGGDFGFPYPNPQDKVNKNREMSRNLFQKDNWPLATRKFQWLLDKFSPPDWTISKGMIYYTDSQLDKKIAQQVRNRLEKIGRRQSVGIVSASLRRIEFGYKNIRFPSLKKGYLTMFKQIMAALENTRDDIIFFTEHDVLYHKTHFDFNPPDKNTFYYNQNVWNLRMPDGHGMHYDVNQLSGLCGYRDALLTHFRERYEVAKEASERMDEGEFNKYVRHMGFEPFTHGRFTWKNKFKYDTWMSEFPNVDIKHGANATGARWRKDQYRNQQLLINWTESDEIPGWGKGTNIVKTLQ